MKLLIDNALSPRVAEGLRTGGYDAVHVGSLGMASADDGEIFHWRLAHEHVVVSADTDFGTLLAQQRESKPSVLLLRRISQRRPEAQVKMLLANLPELTKELDAGAIAVIEENRIRVRPLPILGDSFSRPKSPK